MNTRIFLIRHGQTERNREGIFTGQEDSPLTDLGLKQAENTGLYLKQYRIDNIYSSDLGRAYKTASIISENFGIKPKKDKRLRENNLGLWKGLNMTELIKKQKKSLKNFKSLEYIKPPQGESTYEHRDRVIEAIEDITINNIGSNIVIIAHSGTNKIILSHIENYPISDYYNLSQNNCCINIIDYDSNNQKYSIVISNYIDHLY